MSDYHYKSQVILQGGDSPSSGLLKVYANSLWGTACYSNFNNAAADTACRQLGYTNAFSFSGVSV